MVMTLAKEAIEELVDDVAKSVLCSLRSLAQAMPESNPEWCFWAHPQGCLGGRCKSMVPLQPSFGYDSSMDSTTLPGSTENGMLVAPPDDS
mmetsp:Transcript_114787/g.245001  ORF Transcript_114787/g.245001 Transcript_114787/m.245001 type:complete len:91 (-) Transcript_114787:41-313(-)